MPPSVVSPSWNPKEALDCIESLRRDIESGEVVAFVAVAIEPGDQIRLFAGSSRVVSKLRLIGAVQAMLHDLHMDPKWSRPRSS